MGSSSSTAAAAAAAASSSSSSGGNQNPYMNYYGRSAAEYSARYFDEYCYGGNGYTHQQLLQQQQQQQQRGEQVIAAHHHLISTSQQQLAQQQQQQHQHCRDPYQSQQQQQPHSCSSSSSSSKHHEKKKKWWKRRSSRSNDPGQPLREMLANWSLGEIVALVHEYESMTNEKELYIHAESARPRAPTLRQDLADLLDFKWNSDVNLVLPPAIFPAHRAILSQRAKYFRNILNNTSNVNVNVEDIPSVDIPSFSSMLRYLYTEEQPPPASSSSSSQQQQSSSSGSQNNSSSQQQQHEGIQYLGTLIRPAKPLESDLRDLLQSGKYSDIVLILGDEQFAVHKPILAARSPFFRSLLQRRNNSKKIVLDDTVIPKRYARVILNCMYTDKLDLSLIEPSRSGLSEVENLTFTGKVNPSGFEEAMELYQIGRFLEFDHLCTSSEDIIVESLSHETLPQILRWSSQSHGSGWVRRQSIMYVQEEYASLISTPSFLELDKTTLLEVVQSDFLQASEVEVLNSVIKWGEHQLMKRVEDREPNLVSSTRDSVFRNNNNNSSSEQQQQQRGKGGKRNRGSDKCGFNDIVLNDGELREIVFDLIRCVRTDHIGLQHESLSLAVRRGLVSIPPTHMITEEKVNPWVNTLQCPNYIRPRLYTPYYEEAKSALRVRGPSNSTECLHYSSSAPSSANLSYLNSIGRIKTLRPIIPDTLYMIENSDGAVYGHRHPSVPEMGGGGAAKKEETNMAETTQQDILCSSGGGSGGKRNVDEMVIDQELLNAMVYREKKLRSAHLRNLSNPISRERASKYIRLRVVREFGYPDYVAEVLDHHNRTALNSTAVVVTSSGATGAQSTTTTSITTSATTTSSSTTQTKPDTQTMTTQQQQSPVHQHHHHHHHYATTSATSCSTSNNGTTSPVDFHPNNNMPDVALNTTDQSAAAASAVSSTSLSSTQQNTADSVVLPFLDLDLGDNVGAGGNGAASSNNSALQRSRNRSFGSLRGSATQVTQNLRGSLYSSSGILVGPGLHPHQFAALPYSVSAVVQPPQQQQQQTLYSTTSRVYNCSTSSYAQPVVQLQQHHQPIYSTVRSTTLDHHHQHHHHHHHAPHQQQQHHHHQQHHHAAASSSSSTQSLRSIVNKNPSSSSTSSSSHHVPSHYL